jgi:HlyD family secretion protein
MNKKKTKNKILILAIAFIITIFWVGTVTWFFLVEKKAEEQPESKKKYSLYTIPELQKVFLEGELQHFQQLSFFPDPNKGQVDAINVVDKQLVQLGDVLFTYKNGQESINVAAPFSGVVTFSKETIDEEKKPILTLIDPTLLVVARVTEKDRHKIHKDQPVTISIYGTGQEIEGKIREIEDYIVQNSTTISTKDSSINLSSFPVYISISQHQGLYAGYHVQGVVAQDNYKPKVPKSTILMEDGKSFVWEVVRGHLKKVKIETEKWNKKYVLVKNGLQAGDVIVRESRDDIKEGDKIDIPSSKN